MRYSVKKQLNTWLKENGFDDIKVYNNYDFEAQSANGLIGVSRQVDADGIPSFEQLVQELELKYDSDILTLYFLHELGHTQTYDEFNALDELKYAINNFYITKMIRLFGSRVYGKLNYKYQRLPQEYRATEWAIEYLNNNQVAIKKLEKILKKI